MAKYRVEILDKNLVPLSDVRVLVPLDTQGNTIKYNKQLSDHGMAKIRIGTKDPIFSLGNIVQPYANHLRIYRNGKRVWQGVIVNNPKRNKRYIEVQAYGYLFLLSKVLIRHDTAINGGPGDDVRIFKTGTMASVVRTILTEAKADAGNNVLANLLPGVIENPLFPAGFITSTGASLAGGQWTFSDDLQLQFDFQHVLYVLQGLAQYGTGDFELEQVDTPASTVNTPVTNQVTTTSTNSVINPGFEVDVANWTLAGVGATFTRVASALVPSGAYATLVSPGAGGATASQIVLANVGASRTFTVSGYFRYTGGTGTAFVVTHNGTNMGTLTLTSGYGSFTRGSLTFTTTQTSGAILISLSAGANGTVDGSSFQLEEVAAATTWFDGATGGTWTGTPYASPSIRLDQTTVSSTSTVTVPASTSLVFNFKNFLGTRQPELAFEYSVYGGIDDYNAPTSGEKMANYLVGVAADNSGAVLKLPLSNDASIQTNGKVAGVAAFADVKNANLLQVRLTQELLYVADADGPLDLILNDRAYDLGTYGVGDIVTIIIKDHIIQVHRQVRIVGIDVAVHVTGKDTIRLITNTPRAGQ